MVVVTSHKFTSVDFTNNSTDFLNCCIGEKQKAVIDFYVKWSSENKILKYDSATKTITNQNSTDGTSFIDDGFKIGDTFASTLTTSNNTTFTIADISDKIITVNESVTDEMAESASLFGILSTDISLDFFYNLIENEADEDYFSLTDKKTKQRYFINNINYSATGTTTNLLIATNSFGWVTNTITNSNTGETSEVTIQGKGVTSDYKYQFEIVQYFYNTPFALASQIQNFTNGEPPAPEYYADRKALKYICKLDIRQSQDDPNIWHTGSLTEELGNTSWFDEMSNGRVPEYCLLPTGTTAAVIYKDSITDDILDQLDIQKKVDVTIYLYSKSGRFVNGDPGTSFVVNYINFRQSELDYVNTKTTQRQNFFHDRVLIKINQTLNGDNYGTDYQILTNVAAHWIDSQNAKITFTVDYSSYIKSQLKLKDFTDHYYAIWITTQYKNYDDGSKNTDRTAVLCDFQNADYDQRDKTLFKLFDSKYRCYTFPEIGTNPKDSIGVVDGDPVYINLPFQVLSNGTATKLKTIKVQILATKEGEDDFILEEKILDCSFERSLDGAQTLNQLETRNYISFADQPYNQITLQKVSAFDDGDYKGYMLGYGFVARYEYWQTLVQQFKEKDSQIFNNLEQNIEVWSNINSETGWDKMFRVTAIITNSDGIDTTFQVQDCPIQIRATNELDTLTSSIIEKYSVYNSENDDWEEVNGIEKGALTKVEIEFSGDYSVLPSGTTAATGYIFADLETEGGVLFRRFASTDRPSEDDSPWSPTDKDNTADESYCNGNLRIERYGTNKYVLRGYYDDRKQNWGQKAGSILIYNRLGFVGPTARCTRNNEETNLPLLNETGQARLDEDCPES